MQEQINAGQRKSHTIGCLTQSLSREKDTTHPISSTKRLVFYTNEGNLDIRTGAPNEQHARFQENTHADRPSKFGPRDRSSLVAGVGSPNKFRLQLPGRSNLQRKQINYWMGLAQGFLVGAA